MTASSPQPRVPSEEIAGLVERVTFFNPESGFAVLRVHVRGQRDPQQGRTRNLVSCNLSAHRWWAYNACCYG